MHFHVLQLAIMLNLLYGYLHHKIATPETAGYNFDTLAKETQCSYHVWLCLWLCLSVKCCFLVPVDSCMRYIDGNLLQLHQIMGAYALSLLRFA